MRKFQKGDATVLGILFELSIAVGVVVGVAAVGFDLVDSYQTVGFDARAKDALAAKSLKTITMEKFAKSDRCEKEVPYGAGFVAEDGQGKVVRGTVCISKDQSPRLKI